MHNAQCDCSLPDRRSSIPDLRSTILDSLSPIHYALGEELVDFLFVALE